MIFYLIYFIVLFSLYVRFIYSSEQIKNFFLLRYALLHLAP
ncbi:Hypothetical protein c2565 [Escherichia coli CFT073]|uniref:Uncharacterized protein n=1 Tax=Escherichia coli O6:H1 (strain CFT073 / ATCC 700928 / UPEC) TaxID=199310 RepID=A0A0H2VAZ8_ECOL6|nr:Hypothetical protein c2565 [Escherichia coli CFT073]